MDLYLERFHVTSNIYEITNLTYDGDASISYSYLMICG